MVGYPMGLAIGATFAGYTILRLLGAGGMGEVYLAQHPRLPRNDALKILRADVSADEDYRQRFIREADLAASLWHPHIVAIHDRGECEGRLWISMDYVDGTDGARMLRDHYPVGMPATDAIRIVSAVAEALDYAHPDFWVTIVGDTFPDAASALAWCTRKNLDRDHCYAKLVSTTHPVHGSTAFNP
jgi:serine/threonine protein kinase, bacterial